MKTISDHGLVIKVCEITPEDAAKILSDNTNKKSGKIENYRNLTPATFKSYKSQMEDGVWFLNSHTIAFDTKGKLVDGQHRLSACVASGRPFKSIIVEGVKSSVVKTIDGGKPRVLADHLKYEGGKIDDEHAMADYANEVAIALRLVWLRIGGKKVSGGGKFDPVQAIRFHKQHEAISESVAFVMDVNKENEGILRRCMSLGYLAGLHYLFRSSGATGADTKADKFIRLLALDEKLTAVPVITNLHKILTGERKKEAKLSRDGKVGLIVKAWLAYVSNETVKLTISKDEFPRIGGLDEAPVEDGEEEEPTETLEQVEASAESENGEAAPKAKRKRKVKAKSAEEAQAEADYENDGGE